jgi:hypothetical protein
MEVGLGRCQAGQADNGDASNAQPRFLANPRARKTGRSIGGGTTSRVRAINPLLGPL